MKEALNHESDFDQQTMFHLRGRYSVLLFQIIVNLPDPEHVTHRNFTIPELRNFLGIEKGKLTGFSQINRSAIQPALAQINQISRFTLTATGEKIGRTVVTVEIAWELKPDPTEAKRELERPKIGRKLRREAP